MPISKHLPLWAALAIGAAAVPAQAAELNTSDLTAMPAESISMAAQTAPRETVAVCHDNADPGPCAPIPATAGGQERPAASCFAVVGCRRCLCQAFGRLLGARPTSIRAPEPGIHQHSILAGRAH
jgi:hypothetical protein